MRGGEGVNPPVQPEGAIEKIERSHSALGSQKPFVHALELGTAPAEV